MGENIIISFGEWSILLSLPTLFLYQRKTTKFPAVLPPVNLFLNKRENLPATDSWITKTNCLFRQSSGMFVVGEKPFYCPVSCTYCPSLSNCLSLPCHSVKYLCLSISSPVLFPTRFFSRPPFCQTIRLFNRQTTFPLALPVCLWRLAFLLLFSLSTSRNSLVYITQSPLFNLQHRADEIHDQGRPPINTTKHFKSSTPGDHVSVRLKM